MTIRKGIKMSNLKKIPYISKTKYDTFAITRSINNHTSWGSYKTLEYAEEMIKYLNENNWDRELFYKKYEEIKTKSYEFLKYEDEKYIIYQEINGENIEYGSYNTLKRALNERKKFKIYGFPEKINNQSRITGNEKNGYNLIYKNKRILKHQNYKLLLKIKNYLQEHNWNIENEFKVKNRHVTYFLEKKDNGNLKIVEKHISDKLVIKHPIGKYLLYKVTSKSFKEIFSHSNKEVVMEVKESIEKNNLKLPQHLIIYIKNNIYELYKIKNYLKVFYKNDDPLPIFQKQEELRIIFPIRIRNKFKRRNFNYIYYVATEENKLIIQTKKPNIEKFQKVKLIKKEEYAQLPITSFIQSELKVKKGNYLKFVVENDSIILKKENKQIRRNNKNKPHIKKNHLKENKNSILNNNSTNIYSSKVNKHEHKFITFIPPPIRDEINLNSRKGIVWKLKETKNIKKTYLILNTKTYTKIRTLGRKVETQQIQQTRIGTYINIPDIIIHNFTINENSKIHWKINYTDTGKKYIELIFNK